MFNPNFLRRMKTNGVNISQLLQDAEVDGLQKATANWTGYGSDVIQAGIYKSDRDVPLGRIRSALTNVLMPWLSSGATDLPSIQVKEIARIAKISPEKVINILTENPMFFRSGNDTPSFLATISAVATPGELGIADTRRTNINPKRIIRRARYLSRPPGGGPVQKARVDESRIPGILRREVNARSQILLRKQEPIDSSPDSGVGVMSDLELRANIQSSGAVERILYKEPNGKKLMKVFEWFRSKGDRNWVLGANSVGFADNLVKLSKGSPVDFIIWNCIGFKWFPSAGGQFPSCAITDNLDAAITPYFGHRIQEIAQTLSTIGDPRFTVLVPSNEALNPDVWPYIQTDQERELIVDNAVSGLRYRLGSLPLPDNASLQVMRWDEYLRSKGLEKHPNEYSFEGVERLINDPKLERIITEAIRSGTAYFAQNGIIGIEKSILASRQLQYYGVYAGEGVAFEEIQGKGTGVVVINPEEMRVSQMAFLGARGNLVVVTPIKLKEMQGYYQWETRQIKKRR